METQSNLRLDTSNALQSYIPRNTNQVWSPEGLVQFITNICTAAHPDSSLRKTADLLTANLSKAPESNQALKRYVGIAGSPGGFSDAFYSTITKTKDVLVENDIFKLNALVHRLTEGMLPYVVHPQDVSNTAFVVQVFKDTWLNTMRLTTLKFKSRDLTEKTVDAITGSFLNAFETTGKKQTVITLPYASNYMAIVVLSNTIDEYVDFSEIWNEENWSQIGVVETRRPDSLEKCIYLPKFKCRSEVSLNGVMRSLGMGNLDGIFNPNVPFPKDSKQVTYIEVDEIGTKAAAATMIRLSRGFGTKKETYVIDRPFGFAVIDKNSKTIEFAALIENL